MTNLVLTGMRGTGKSKLGQKIAKTLKRKFIDIDREIERQERMPIRKIVDKKGWNYFRKIEKYVTRRVAKQSDIVISTGGGTIIDPENAKKLKKHGLIVLLTAPTEILATRIKQKESEAEKRPALTKIGNTIKELDAVWEKRKETYQENADYVVDISQDSDNYKNDLKTKSKQIIELVAAEHPEFQKPE